MSRAPRVSLLLPNHNNGHTIALVLDRLAENTTYPETELVVVDDGSTDESRDILRCARDSGRFERFKLIEKPNTGAIDSLNTALHEASGELCVQLDADATVETSGWVERMLDLMQLDESVGVVTAKVVFDSGSLHACGVNVVGAAGWHERPTRVAEPLGERLWLNRLHRCSEGEGGEAESRVAEVDSGIGCCMMYRREDALEVGGYDPKWSPVWFDDVDLCLKIRVLGRKAFYLPDVRVIHHFGTRRGPRNLRTWLQRGNVKRVGIKYGSRALPHRARASLERRFVIDLEGDYTKAQCARLRHHHVYWREKWGWDARNPDMDEIRRRWGGTEVCWASDPERRAAGERIARTYEAARGTRIVAAIVTRNRRQLLAEGLRAVMEQSHPLDGVVVVDNASEDGTAEMLRAEFPSVVVVPLAVNQGATGGYYEGIRRACAEGADWLWLLDDDSVPRPDALAQLLHALERLNGGRRPALLGGRVEWTDGEPHPMNMPVVRTRDPDEVVRALRRALLPLRAASWVSLLLSREAVEREAMPKRQFFYQADDIEYTARVLRRASGYFVPASVVEHRTETRHTAVDDDGRFFYHARNTLLMLRGDAWTLWEKQGLVRFLVRTSIVYLRANRFTAASVRNLLSALEAGLRTSPA